MQCVQPLFGRSTMKPLSAVLALVFAVSGAAGAAELPLHVLYVGPGKGDRPAEFERFLKRHVARVTAADRSTFDPAAARAADVVLLDWSQSEGDWRATPVPFGRLDDWSKPTVLYNHSGLMVAERWQVVGSYG